MHKLEAFSKAHDHTVDIKFHAERQASLLNFEFYVSADQDELIHLTWPETVNARPSRQDELWKTTVFELFVADADLTNYYEFNFSPSWDWAAYAFEDERKDMHLLRGIKENPLKKIIRREKELHFAGSIDLKILGIKKSVEASATAILDWNGQLEYWATNHASDQPDFHNRNSFIITL